MCICRECWVASSLIINKKPLQGSSNWDVLLQALKSQWNKMGRHWCCIGSRAGYHKVPCDAILSQYFAHDNITIQRFLIYSNTFHPWYIMIFVSLKKFWIWLHWISFPGITKHCQFYMNDSQVKQSVYCTVALKTHTHTHTHTHNWWPLWSLN